MVRTAMKYPRIHFSLRRRAGYKIGFQIGWSRVEEPTLPFAPLYRGWFEFYIGLPMILWQLPSEKPKDAIDSRKWTGRYRELAYWYSPCRWYLRTPDQREWSTD